MADTAVQTPDAAEIASTPTKKTSASGGSPKKAKSVKPKTKANHPPTSGMVNSAIKSLKERGGSSLQAIKKYIAANYKADAEKLSPFIKKYIKSAVASGVLVQTKGKGASGSFKLAAAGATSGGKAAAPKAKAKKVVKRSPPAKPKSSPAAKKTKVAAKKAPAAKPASPAAKGKKRAAPAPVSAPAEKRAAVAKPKSPSKAKKTTKVPTKKPKAPKPKKTTGGKAKKAAPKRK